MRKLAKNIPNLQINDITKFITKINFSRNCWEWNGVINEKGYGEFYLNSFNYLAHRISYEIFTSEKIPLDMTIDHLCRNRKCVNPNHLEIVTYAENIRRNVPFRKEVLKQFCKNGHKLTKNNTVIRIVNGNTWRVCIKCKNKTQLKYYYKKLRKGTS